MSEIDITDKQEHDFEVVKQFTLQAQSFSEAPSLTDEATLELICRVTNVSSKDDVLDVGCGPGIVACHMAKYARSVVGIDLTPAMIEEARVRQEAQNLANISWRVGDVTPLPFENEQFSLVVSRYASHHFFEPQPAFDEMVRVCQRGGALGIIDVTPDPMKRELYDKLERMRDPSHAKALMQSEFMTLAEKHKLRLEAHEFYRSFNSLEKLLERSFPLPGDEQRLRDLYRDDSGVDKVGFAAELRDGEIYLGFPTTIFLWRKD